MMAGASWNRSNMLALVVCCLLQRAAAEMSNPVEVVDQGLMLVVMVIGLFIFWWMRDRIVLFLTGDQKIHCDLNSVLWFLLTCGDSLDGEWTRVWTKRFCCCWPQLKGRNLLRLAGQKLGVLGIPIQISNIIVGDLPTLNNGDFYLSVEVSSNPVQNSSLSEAANPKVVTFVETLLLRVRNSYAENNVRFVVKQLHTLGSEELCEAWINPIFLLKWAQHDNRPRRIRMEPCSRSEIFLFPPWILMDIQHKVSAHAVAESEFAVRVTNSRTMVAQEIASAEQFKSTYQLLSTTGMKAEEPSEKLLGELESLNHRKGTCQKTLLVWIVILPFIYVSIHLYSFACWKQYKAITVLDGLNFEFPVEPKVRQHWVGRCGLDGNLLAEVLMNWAENPLRKNKSKAELARELHTDPRCLIEDDDIFKTCTKLPIGAHFPKVSVMLGPVASELPCSPWTCQMDRVLKAGNTPAFLIVLALIFAFLMVTAVCNHRMAQVSNGIERHFDHYSAQDQLSSEPMS
eukprot:TRINITY_DN42514_c0_g1_i1.p1 TRINITY_DN42514_c0_g1~~TRINITY_DN42514_c0_g1_i1.p1  ORF type:complete len:513 (+),score=49.55 TRINITY_DN42514_c0_g1_i1:72-1610(+)